MILVAAALLGLMAISGLVMAYVAYIDRGESIPHAPRLSDAMVAARRRVDGFVAGEQDREHDDRQTSDTAA